MEAGAYQERDHGEHVHNCGRDSGGPPVESQSRQET
jgi:hypothetical protein